MAKTCLGITFRSTACVVGLVLTLAATLPTLADEKTEAATAPPNTTKTVMVGKAKMTWHLTPNAAVKQARTVVAYKQATEARLTGGEPFVTPKERPERLPGGETRMRLPVELMPTLFIGADGRPFCSDSTMTKKSEVETGAAAGGR